jgi:peptide subunit release factor RF-3
MFKGTEQLAQEGGVQVCRLAERGDRDPACRAVERVQPDVLAYLLQSERNVPERLEPALFVAARWVSGPREDVGDLGEGVGWLPTLDRDDKPVALARNACWLDELPRVLRKLGLSETSGATTT